MGYVLAMLACLTLGTMAVAQQNTGAGAQSGTPPQAEKPQQPVTAQQKKPPPRPDSFKPTEEVRADTILTLPSDI